MTTDREAYLRALYPYGGNLDALRGLIAEEVQKALGAAPSRQELAAALEDYQALCADIPQELACDADWRARRDALQKQAAALLETLSYAPDAPAPSVTVHIHQAQSVEEIVDQVSKRLIQGVRDAGRSARG